MMKRGDPCMFSFHHFKQSRIRNSQIMLERSQHQRYGKCNLACSTLIQQSEDEIFTEFLFHRNILHLVGRWQIKTVNTQKLETTATAQRGCLDTARWLEWHRNSDYDPASSLCHWPQMPVPLVYKGGIFQLGLQMQMRKRMHCH